LLLAARVACLIMVFETASKRPFRNSEEVALVG
jgi:hypothetical protein